MKRGIIAAVLAFIIFLTLLPANAVAAVTASPELYRSSIYTNRYLNAFAIKADNSLWGWGYNTNTPLNPGVIIGQSAQENYLTPVKVADNVLTVASSEYCTLILKTNGELWGWGTNYLGTMGLDSSIVDVWKPLKIMENVIDIKTSFSHAVALKNDGTLWHWGRKLSTDYWDMYTPSVLLENVAALCNSEYAIKEDGTMWELTPFAPTGPLRPIPPQKIELTQEAQNAKTLYHNAYITTDGSLWRWGDNGHGEVTAAGAGYGIFTEPVPMENAIMKLDDVVFYDGDSAAVKKDGSLWTWGSNQNGAMGKGDEAGEYYSPGGGGDFGGNPYYTTPVKIMDDVVFGYKGLAVKKDGSLWSWGYAGNGILGNGSLRDGIEKNNVGEESYPTPQKILDGLRVTNPAANIPPPKYSAAPASSTVFVNGKNVSFEAYNINGYNFFKLRDLAYALNGTERQFEVGWDTVNNTISLTTGMAYTGTGGESTVNAAGVKTALPSSSKIFVDGKEIQAIAYTIDNSNYFKLRDIGEAIGFNVSWDSSQNSILIKTASSF